MFICIYCSVRGRLYVKHLSRQMIPYVHGADTGVVALCYFRSIFCEKLSGISSSPV